MNRSEIEERYLDVLQDIEAPVIALFRTAPEMTDWEMEQALDALIVAYEREQRPRFSPARRLPPLAQQAHDRMRAVCEWRMERAPQPEETYDSIKEQAYITRRTPKNLDEILACLKRTRASLQFWGKEGGRQGYLTYVNSFFPVSPSPEVSAGRGRQPRFHPGAPL